MIRTRQLQYAYPDGGATLTFPDVDVPQGAVLLAQRSVGLRQIDLAGAGGRAGGANRRGP
jgi:hypothetical protein